MCWAAERLLCNLTCFWMGYKWVTVSHTLSLKVVFDPTTVTRSHQTCADPTRGRCTFFPAWLGPNLQHAGPSLKQRPNPNTHLLAASTLYKSKHADKTSTPVPKGRKTLETDRTAAALKHADAESTCPGCRSNYRRCWG